MNCEGVRTVIDVGISGSTVAERNAACVHLRTCKKCQAMIVAEVAKIPPEEDALVSAIAIAAWQKDRSDPEWK